MRAKVLVMRADVLVLGAEVLVMRPETLQMLSEVLPVDPKHQLVRFEDRNLLPEMVLGDHWPATRPIE